jgi:hypothetical protein
MAPVSRVKLLFDKNSCFTNNDPAFVSLQPTFDHTCIITRERPPLFYRAESANHVARQRQPRDTHRLTLYEDRRAAFQIREDRVSGLEFPGQQSLRQGIFQLLLDRSFQGSRPVNGVKPR